MAKWGVYADKLKYNNKTQFMQHVPENSETIKKSLESQNILDAVYNPKKAFWLADPKQFKLASSAGKVMMVYTFSSAGARSLMEDALICGSGDFDADNPEPWVGEASHPNYTIWKTNELGAYGVGANRLKTLSGQVQKIQAYDSKGKEIKK